MRSLALGSAWALPAVLAAGALSAQVPPRGAPVRLPVRYVADRFFVAPVTPRGDTLVFYTDTGGGVNKLFVPTAARLGLHGDTVQVDGRRFEAVPFPGFASAASIPAPTLPSFMGSRLAVAPLREMERFADGFLGSGWFADRVWTFDYPGRALWLRAPGDVPAVAPEHRAALGFQLDSSGMRTTHFPRIRVAVDGDSLDLLFDTGAMTLLTDGARAALNDGGPAIRGTSFMRQGVVDGWRARHPEWRVVERAERSGVAMIEVPVVDVGGYRVGPVWFTARPDAKYHPEMSRWMDRPVDGALGGSALRYLRVTVDYPSAAAFFERP